MSWQLNTTDRPNGAAATSQDNVEPARSLLITSTCTRYVPAQGCAFDDCLLMFGVRNTTLSQTFSDVAGGGWSVLDQQADPDPGDVPPGDDNLGFVVSSAGEPYDFLIDGSSTLYTTVIPETKRAQWWHFTRYTYASDGTHTSEVDIDYFDVIYMDACVVDLPDGSYLMLLSRYRVRRSDPSVEETLSVHGPTVSIGDIVGYVAPSDDPSFQGTGVKGPYLIVSSMNAINDALKDGGTVDGEVYTGGTNFRTWLGVPAATFGEDDISGDTVLWVYNIVEAQDDHLNEDIDEGETGWNQARRLAGSFDGHGTMRYKRAMGVKKILWSDLQLVMADNATWQSERWWGGAWRNLVVPGEVFGPVRVWWGHPNRGGVPFLEQFPDAHTAAPQVHRCDSGVLWLIFAVTTHGNTWDAEVASPALVPATGRQVYGIWRAKGLATATTSSGVSLLQGRDFWIDTDTGPIIESVIGIDAVDGISRTYCLFYADPDLVPMPDGTFRIYCGYSKLYHDTSISDTNYGNREIDGEAGDLCGSFVGAGVVDISGIDLDAVTSTAYWLR